jgi:hypothetical protein
VGGRGDERWVMVNNGDVRRKGNGMVSKGVIMRGMRREEDVGSVWGPHMDIKKPL